jgi:hypothetical protein
MALLRPYLMHAFLLAYAAAVLVVDGALASYGVQVALGLLTTSILVLWAARLDPSLRLQAALCVPVATLFEIFGSLLWGGYTYRLENIPAFVPPGHALVFLFGVTASSLPLLQRHGRLFAQGTLAVCAAWAIAGVTVLPSATGRLDLQGLAWLPLFAWCVLRSRRGTLFAAIFVATAVVELAGTWSGSWVWEPVAPWSGLPSGNPPAAVAAGYAVIDGSIALLVPLARRALRPALAAAGSARR